LSAAEVVFAIARVGATALAEVRHDGLDLPVRTGGAPCPRGLTFFCLATSSRSEVNVGEADGPKGEAAGRVKESKQRKGDYGVGYVRGVDISLELRAPFWPGS
jgi:hypothetical protein